MKIIQLLFGGYKLVHKNDLNALYGQTYAAYARLKKIKISDDRLKYGVEKDQVLSLLNDSSKIISRILD